MIVFNCFFCHKHDIHTAQHASLHCIDRTAGEYSLKLFSNNSSLNRVDVMVPAVIRVHRNDSG
ncbi:hypothetical protein D3C75_1033530 [compost metagenome]